MPIITLTTDLGMRDYYAAAIKGELLKAIPGIEIIDISHEIEPFNMFHAAFVIENAYRHFPEETIHLIGVNSFHDQETSTLIIRNGHYWFIGPDNGLFGLIWEEGTPKEIYKVHLTEMEKGSTLPLRDAYIRVAKHLAEGKSPLQISDSIPAFRIRTTGKPIISKDFIRGTIVYFDRFGNAMVNIRKKDFELAGNGKRFVVMFKKYADVETLSANYSAVDESEKLCFFNSSGYLEIALNKGNARNLLNLNVGDNVQIDFSS